MKIERNILKPYYIIIFLLSLICIALSIIIIVNNVNKIPNTCIEPLNTLIEEENVPNGIVVLENQESVLNGLKTPNMRMVTFTNYYAGDSDGSTSKTGSGHSTDEFEINDKGWYTYNGMIVIASATYECMNSNYGNCKLVNSEDDLPNGFGLHHYYDVINFSIDGVSYDGIILDSCFSSWWNEEYQRYDIMIANKKYAFGKVKGTIYE